MLSPRLARFLAELAVAVGLLMLLVWLRTVAGHMSTHHFPASPQAPQEFRLVVDWYDYVYLTQSRREVEELLGPPTQHAVQAPEFAELIKVLEHSNRHLGLPADREWVRWVDPANPERSATILFAGDKVYYKTHVGFDSATR